MPTEKNKSGLRYFSFRQLCVESDRLCTGSYNIKMNVFRYQSIKMHRLVLSEEFDGRLSISVLRNEQPSPFGKVHPPWKKSHFFRSQFSCKRNRQPTIKFNVGPEVLFIYRLIPRKFGFCESIAFFDTTPISRFLGGSRSVHGRIQHTIACFWVSIDRYALHRVACKI
jgi:hypothetical protein